MRNQWILSCFVEPKVTGVISPVTICVCVCVCVCTRACAHTQLSLTLCNPWTVVRILEWVAISSDLKSSYVTYY